MSPKESLRDLLLGRGWLRGALRFVFHGSELKYTPVKKHSRLEIPPFFLDVFPIGKGGFPASYVSLPEGR